MKLFSSRFVIFAGPAILLLVTILSCLNSTATKPFTRNELQGKYVQNFGKPPEEIYIHGDGTYIHKYFHKGSEVIESNNWMIDRNDAEFEYRLCFEKFTMGDAWTDRAGACGYWPPLITSYMGQPRLQVDSDLNLFFDKQ